MVTGKVLALKAKKKRKNGEYSWLVSGTLTGVTQNSQSSSCSLPACSRSRESDSQDLANGEELPIPGDLLLACIK
jgi:hypothetical protein